MRYQICKVVAGAIAGAAIIGLTACSSSSSSGTFGITFNVSGPWAGIISDPSGPNRSVTVTLVDNGGTVSGTVTIAAHSCISSGKVSGTSTQASSSTSGDNPLTADNENNNRGFLTLNPESGSSVTSVTIVAAGSGYVEPPVVEFKIGRAHV